MYSEMPLRTSKTMTVIATGESLLFILDCSFIYLASDYNTVWGHLEQDFIFIRAIIGQAGQAVSLQGENRPGSIRAFSI